MTRSKQNYYQAIKTDFSYGFNCGETKFQFNICYYINLVIRYKIQHTLADELYMHQESVTACQTYNMMAGKRR